MDGRNLRTMLDVSGDGCVAEFRHEICFPVLEKAMRQQPIEQALDHRVRHRAREGECGRAELLERADRLLALGGIPVVSAYESAHCFHMQRLGEGWTGRHDQKGKKDAQLPWRR